jgi:isopentenyldiphosphate isomerase
VLEWVEKDRISELNLWEGDRIFFRLLEEQKEFFSLKLVYNKQDILEQAVLDAKELELFDILNEDGSKTGVVKERGVAHREGALHGTVHIWIVRENDKSGYDVLLQKRSDNKDSYPGCYDISSAGHISAGDGVMESALREFEEELGLSAQPEQLELFGTTLVKFGTTFAGKIFRDNEFSNDFVYRQPVDIGKLKLQNQVTTFFHSESVLNLLSYRFALPCNGF